MQVDLSTIATPVETKKRTNKKRKVETEEEARPATSGKSIKSLPVKEKKPPTEKQIAARERLKQARLEKIEHVKAERARLDEEIRLKAEELAKKKAEIAEKRRLKREEKKAAMPQLPVKTSDPGRTGDVEPPKPTISETLATVGTVAVEEEVERPKTPPTEIVDNPNLIHLVTPGKAIPQSVPDAPKREYFQRFRTYPFGRSVPTTPRFR